MDRNLVLRLVTGLLVPITLIGLALRVLLTPAYLMLEYNMPYFPVDEYGFTREDRLQWAPYALNYLVNKEGIAYLGELRFEDGTALFNARELSHMEDVKNITRGALGAWYWSLAGMAALGLWAWRGGWMQVYLQGLRQGGWLIVGLAAAIGLIVLAGIVAAPSLFWDFFGFFHSLFFEGDTWIFPYSDTLIRLFPIRFWQDAFLLSALISVGGGLALALGLRSAHNPAPTAADV